jgi:Ca2+-binding EF-hand superfamily protein
MRIRNLVVGTLLITGVIFTAGCMGKFSHGDIGNKMFSKYDTNEDGYLNEKEYVDVALSRFDRADDNEDGTVTKDELKDNRIAKIIPDFIDNYFKKNDLNSDGIVTKNEIINQTKEDFVSSDIDGDSKLTKDEMKAFRMESRFNKIDTDKDGVISKDEYKKQKTPFNRQ